MGNNRSVISAIGITYDESMEGGHDFEPPDFIGFRR